MPGRWVQEKSQFKNLEVVRVDAENNSLLVKGSCSGTEEMSGNDQRNSKERQIV